MKHLLGRYGTLIRDVVALINERPARPAAAAAPKYLKVEAVYGVSHEGALHLDDILARRTRISVDTWDRGDAAARRLPIWSRRCWAGTRPPSQRGGALPGPGRAEIESQEQLDDRTADAARLGAESPGERGTSDADPSPARDARTRA